MKISVAICTYNGEKYVEEQLYSILHQTHPVDEIIVSDDGSTDSTISKVEQILNNSKIKYKIVQNNSSLKVVKNFHQCYSLCSGDVIFSCDQDDIWETNKVETIMNVFENNDVDLIATNALLVDGVGKSLNSTLRENVGFTLPSKQEDWIDRLLQWFVVTGATMAFRKDFFETSFYDSKFWLHDGWLALMAALNNRMYYIDECLIQYRLHSNNTCGLGMFSTIPTALVKPYYFEDYAKERYDLYTEIKKYIESNSYPCILENKYKLDTCIDFWNKRANLKKLSFRECKKLCDFYKKNDIYIKYTKDRVYYWLDFYFWFIYKILPRKKRMG